MAAIYPADTFQEGVDLTIEASNQLAQVVRGDANTEVMVADGSTIPSIRKAQADSMYFKEPELWTTGQTETDYLQLKKYIDPITNKESWWFAKGATVLNPVAMGTSPFGDDNWTLYTPEDLFISGKAEYESIYQALKGKAAEAGYNLVRGSFEEGANVSGWPDVVWSQTDGKYYQWHLDEEKTVSANSTPDINWVDKSSKTLRTALLAHENDYSAHPQLTAFITAEADRAEAAADAAMNAAGVFSDTSAGVAGTSNGVYFYIPSASTSGFLDLYKNSSGIATFIKTNPSDAVINELQQTANSVIDDAYAGLVLDMSNGTSYAQVDTLIFGNETEEIGRIYGANKSISFEKMKPNVLEAGEISETDGESFELLDATKTIGNERYQFTLDPEAGELKTSFKIVDESNQTKPAVTRWDGTFPSIRTDVTNAAFLLSNRVYQATPTICRTGNRYWAAWRADINNVSEGNGNFFVIAYSDDNCSTFNEKYILSYDPSDFGHTLIDPMLWTSPDGELWLIWTQATGDWYPTLGAHDGVGGCFAAIMQNPEGLFQTWGKPFQFKEMGNPRHPVRVNGEYMICTDLIAYSATYPAINSGNTGCTFCKFDYRNKRVIEIGRNSPNYKTTRYTGFFETELIELTDGKLMSMTRMTQNDGGFARSYSDDGGKTWSAQEELNTLLGDISSSRVWLGRLKSGRMLLVYNNSTDRTLMTAAISEDDGVTFQYRVQLDPTLEASASYPIVAEGDNGNIYVCHDVGREIYNQIRISHIIESEVIAGTSVPSNTIISDPLA